MKADGTRWMARIFAGGGSESRGNGSPHRARQGFYGGVRGDLGPGGPATHPRCNRGTTGR